MKLPLERYNKELEALNNFLSESKSSNKSTYAQWVSHFDIGMGMGNRIEFEALLSYWLSWHALPSGPEDGLNPFVFSLAIRFTKGERSVLAPIYLGSLSYRLDECIRNSVKPVRRYHIVTHANTTFLASSRGRSLDHCPQSPHNLLQQKWQKWSRMGKQLRDLIGFTSEAPRDGRAYQKKTQKLVRTYRHREEL